MNRRAPLTFEKNQAWVVFKKLNIKCMLEAGDFFIGKHDFNSFRSIDCQSSSSIKTINSFKVIQIDDEIIINVSAKSFLHSQVRIMVGTLVEVGKDKIKPETKKYLRSVNILLIVIAVVGSILVLFL